MSPEGFADPVNYAASPDFPSNTTATTGSPVFSPQSIRSSTIHPLKDVQEACLMRFFVDELTRWFDICNERRLFHLSVPQRAMSCPTLLNAIFAASARHLTRVPQYRTAHGIMYQGQLLPHLTTDTAVEYMLKCIPGLIDFENVADQYLHENLIVAATILRHHEEVDDDIEEARNDQLRLDTLPSTNQRFNFLDVTQTILRSAESSLSDPRQKLAHSAFWIAVRQEIIHAFTGEQEFRIAIEPNRLLHSNAADELVMYCANVAKWRWGGKSPQEWAILKAFPQQKSSQFWSLFVPLHESPADKSKGELFPKIWFTSDLQITGIQYFELARMVLIAEDPVLELDSRARAAQRKAEAEVREIIMKICGIALSNLNTPPAFVTATLGISLYGEFFTDPRERESLIEVLELTETKHAWPTKSIRDKLAVMWELDDGV